ncbi:MAG: aspartate ammonia-lyase [Candidatus Cloacimonetes bacterium]|nr:aspartate ammonia-lyase [Candidatus Cloacimonadota bacterium]
MKTRTEEDSLGGRQIPAESLLGIHGIRALENFGPSGRALNPALLKAFARVKQACLRVNHRLTPWPDQQICAMEQACEELSAGRHLDQLPLDALQGGAGTSTNLAVCEVLANRALQILGLPAGSYDTIHPSEDFNRHQSTNDTFPTAVRLAALWKLQALEQTLGRLCDSISQCEHRFADVVRMGRTQFQDAVPLSLGKGIGAWGEALGRDRWRLQNAAERLRVINLGGTAIGTGAGAPREYIFAVAAELNRLTGLGLCRAENLLEATQNVDSFVEVSGLLCACATTLQKVAGDLRVLSARRESGLAELWLPALQEGSSLMPRKINPVIPEAVIQRSLTVQANHQRICGAAALGSLELNPFLPLIADALLESIELLDWSCSALDARVLRGLECDPGACARGLEGSTATLTALIPRLGHDGAMRLGQLWQEQGGSLKQCFLDLPGMSEQDWDDLLGEEAVTRLGWLDAGPEGRRVQ